MTPSTILDIFPKLLIGLHFWAREELFEWRAGEEIQNDVGIVFRERLTGHLERLDHGVEIFLVGAITSGSGVETKKGVRVLDL